MCTLDDILDEGSKFHTECSSVFHNLYIVHAMKYTKYFPKLSCLIAADGGTLHSKWAPYNGCYALHS